MNDGGPAFPIRTTSLCDRCGKRIGMVPIARGMSLRDWFAGKALEGDLACQDNQDMGYYTPPFYKLAIRCYMIADAMLAEREKK